MLFPSLENQVPIQYKSFCKRPSQHVSYHFLGNQRQALDVSNFALKAWVLKYEALVMKEINQLRAFYESVPPLGSFEFNDPWTGVRHQRVRFTLGGIAVSQVGPNSFRAECELEEAT